MRNFIDMVVEAQASPMEEFVKRVDTSSLPAKVELYPIGTLGEFTNVVEIATLESPRGGQGSGRATMAAVLAMADELKVTLCLWPVPDYDIEGSLGGDDLIAWYQRLGFTEEWVDRYDDGDINEWRMVRLPRQS